VPPETHLLFGGSGILGFALASHLSLRSNNSRVFIATRTVLPDWFGVYPCIESIHVDFSSIASLETILLTAKPDHVWFLLSDNDNSSDPDRLDSILTNHVYPSTVLALLSKHIPRTKFIYVSSVLAADSSHVSLYSTLKSSFSQLISNVSDFLPVSPLVLEIPPLIGPGERRSRRLIPTLIKDIMTGTNCARLASSQLLRYSSSLIISRRLVEAVSTVKGMSTRISLPADYEIEVNNLRVMIDKAISQVVLMPTPVRLSQFEMHLKDCSKKSIEDALMSSVLHWCLYDHEWL
jgi:hypothetical protein